MIETAKSLARSMLDVALYLLAFLGLAYFVGLLAGMCYTGFVDVVSFFQ